MAYKNATTKQAKEILFGRIVKKCQDITNWVCSRYSSIYHIDKDDLVQESLLILLKCADAIKMDGVGLRNFKVYYKKAMIRRLNRFLKTHVKYTDNTFLVGDTEYIENNINYSSTTSLDTAEEKLLADTMLVSKVVSWLKNDKHKKIVWYKFVEKMSYAEIGREVLISKQCVEQTLKRILVRIKEKMELEKWGL